MPAPTFKDLEQQGWDQRASAYDSWFATITNQAVEPVLDALAPDLNGSYLLDICTGTGHLAGGAGRRGARAQGLDFSPEMVARSRVNYPEVPFRVGDAEDLPHEDGAFDYVTCGFGHHHFSDPDQAIEEVHRVLKPGGTYAFLVWCGPERGGVFFELFLAAIQRHGRMDVGLPPAPPIFRFDDPDEAKRSLEMVGFITVRTTILDLSWEPDSGEEVLELIYKSIVRAPMLLDRQTEAARERIHAEIIEKAEALRSGDRLKINFPATLVMAEKKKPS